MNHIVSLKKAYRVVSGLKYKKPQIARVYDLFKRYVV